MEGYYYADEAHYKSIASQKRQQASQYVCNKFEMCLSFWKKIRHGMCTAFFFDWTFLHD